MSKDMRTLAFRKFDFRPPNALSKCTICSGKNSAVFPMNGVVIVNFFLKTFLNRERARLAVLGSVCELNDFVSDLRYL